MYRYENSQLKYVLEVVNFLGRSDSATMLRMEKGVATNEFATQHIFDDPGPIWTRLGDDFHAYSAHWHKNEYSAGGEVVTVAVGLQRSPVKFRCSLIYPDAATTMVTGLFSYTRVEMATSVSKDTEHYHVYKFLCKVTKDFAPKGPRIVVFYDIQSGSADHFMNVNNLSAPPHTNHNGKPQSVSSKSSVAACVDFIPYNITKNVVGQSNVFSDKEIFQFFLHHAIIGLQDFLVYEMGNFPAHSADLLEKRGIRIVRLPFNFPYELGDGLKIRGILELDCLLRTSAHVKFVLLTRMNEFFMSTSNVRLNRTFVQSLELHPDNINRFELPLQTICMPEQTTRSEMREEYHMYDANARSDHPVYVYRPNYKLMDTVKAIELSQASGIVHRYSRHCLNSVNLKDWRETLTPEHLHFITEVQKELKGLLL